MMMMISKMMTMASRKMMMISKVMMKMGQMMLPRTIYMGHAGHMGRWLGGSARIYITGLRRSSVQRWRWWGLKLGWCWWGCWCCSFVTFFNIWTDRLLTFMKTMVWVLKGSAKQFFPLMLIHTLAEYISSVCVIVFFVYPYQNHGGQFSVCRFTQILELFTLFLS